MRTIKCNIQCWHMVVQALGIQCYPASDFMTIPLLESPSYVLCM